MLLHQSQSKIASSRSRFRVVNCGRRFGKTLLSCWEMFAYALAKNDARIAYIAPTYQQARDIAWAELKRICQPIMEGQPNDTRLEIKIKNKFGGTSLIMLRGWESVETIRGQAFDFLVLDEVSSYRNFWINWQEVLRPTLTDRIGHALFISTPKGFNHFYDLYNLQSKDRDYESFHFTTYDNPHVPKEEIDKAREELTEDRFAQEYLADFRKTEGLVYKEFDRDLHVYTDEDVKDDPIIKVKLFGGVDFGFTNPCAILTIEKDNDARYFVTGEWYKKGQTDAQIADYVAVLQWNECYPDPESAGGIKELENRNINVREVIKNKDSIRNGTNVVRELFKSNRLYIHESCTNLIWELETYSYPEKKSEHNEEENPIKENDHACDALRYALSMENMIQPTSAVSIYRPAHSGFSSRKY
jgi:PBSX family phage terminase large subunit